MAITYRQAEPDDHAKTYDIVTRAMQEFRGRHNFSFPRASAIQPTDLALRQYAHEFHRGSYWMSEDAERAIGFGLAVRNEGRWYLIALHVLPEYQGRGVGQRLLELTLSTSDRASDALCVLADSIQPVSTAMYIRAGMLPWIPTFEWEGAMPNAGPEPPEGASFRSGASPRELDEIDREVLGIRRPREHLFWLEKRGLEVEILSRNGSPAGYVYFSEKGEIGPAAATAEAMMEPLALRAVRMSKDRGADHVKLKIPGHSPALQSVAASLGLRVQAPASTLLASRPLWPLGHYLLSGSDSLL